MIKLIQKIVVIAMFAIPAIGFMVTPNDYVIKGENRLINQMPVIGAKQYFSQLVNWYNDRLLFKLHTTENLYSSFHNVFTDFNFSGSQYTVEGTDGWLYIGDSADKVYSQHCQEMKSHPNMVVKKLSLIEGIRSSFDGKFYFVVGPDKHGIYPENMNPYIREPGKHRFFNQIRKYLDEKDFTIIDNYDVLRAAKDPIGKISLYYTDDTHWNRYGAHIAFENVMSQVIDNFKPIEYKFKFSKHTNGDLIRNIKNPEKNILDNAEITNPLMEDVTVTHLADKSTRTYKFNSNQIDFFGSKYVNNSAILDKKIMLVSDSYGIFFAPYVVDYFKTVIHVHRQTEDPSSIIETVKKEQPDIVLFINVERSVMD